jgi:hypothetical protein
MIYQPGDPRGVRRFRISPRRSPHVRHWRKYRSIRLPSSLHFLFRDEHGVLRGTSANIEELHHALRGCESEVLRNHVPRHDLSRWIDQAIQDTELSRDLRTLEDDFTASSRDERQLTRFREAAVRAVERRYLD